MNRKPLTSILLALGTLAAFLGGLGCVNPHAGDTGTTILYVYDDASQTISVWNDINTIYNLGGGATAPAPNRTITSPVLQGQGSLAWGGLTLNTSTNELFLVFENSTVVRIERANVQNSNLTSTADINSFTLGTASNLLSSSVFAQASVDSSSGSLYACETGSNLQARIWAVASPNLLPNQSQAPSGSYIMAPTGTTNDTGGLGVASARNGNVFAFFTGGQAVYDTLGTLNTGPRLRLSSGNTFPASSNVILGTKTALWDGTNTPSFGTVAYDSVDNLIYVARPLPSITSSAAVLAFYQSQFTGGNMNSAATGPVITDTTGSLPNLRFIAHAGAKDWMAGADLTSGSAPVTSATTVTGTTTGTGQNLLHIWKGPSQGGASRAFTLPVNALGTAVQVRGLALDGSQ